MVRKAEKLMDIVNIFQPEPLSANEIDFYEPTAIARDGMGCEYHEMLYEHLCNADKPMHFLVIGHSGCGKTTEMYMLAKNLTNECDNTPSVIINATKDLNLSDFTYIDIFMLIVERLAKYADENKIKINERIIRAFEAALSTRITREHWEQDLKASIETEAGISAEIPFITKLAAKITSSIRLASGLRDELRLELKPKMSEITEAVNAFISDINAQGNDIVIMIDGLEKCRHECVRTLFIEDGTTLAAVKTHMVISCPLSLYRSSDKAMLQSNFPFAELMPMIKTHYPNQEPYPSGVNVIENIIKRRVDASFFTGDSLNMIVKMGGGNLRETFHLLRGSAFLAHIKNKGKAESQTIDEDCVIAFFDKYSTDVFLGVKNKYYPTLKKIYDGNVDLENDEAINELLYAGAVFEYNAERWKDLNPLIRYHIDKKPEVIDSNPGVLD